MARVKRGVTAHARHKKILNLAKGYRGRKKNVFRRPRRSPGPASMRTATGASRNANFAPFGLRASMQRRGSMVYPTAGS